MLTEKELILIKHLRRNSRKSLRKIGEEEKVPVSTLFDSLRRLESGIITKHSSLLNFHKMGYHIKVNFALSSSKKKDLKDFLMKSGNVNNLFLLTNGYHFFAECVFKDLNEMENFKDNLRKFNLAEFQENFVLEEIKKEEFLM